SSTIQHHITLSLPPILVLDTSAKPKLELTDCAAQSLNHSTTPPLHHLTSYQLPPVTIHHLKFKIQHNSQPLTIPPPHLLNHSTPHHSATSSPYNFVNP